MKDIVLKSNLNSFIAEFALDHLKESEQFEHFSNYCILSRVVDGPIDALDVWVGKNSTFGVDGAAIIVNENIALEIEEIDSLVQRIRHLDAHFVFVQSKTSDSFESGEILKLFNAVENFFQMHLIFLAPTHCKIFITSEGTFTKIPTKCGEARR